MCVSLEPGTEFNELELPTVGSSLIQLFKFELTVGS